jgi:hypothetical protein
LIGGACGGGIGTTDNIGTASILGCYLPGGSGSDSYGSYTWPKRNWSL